MLNTCQIPSHLWDSETRARGPFAISLYAGTTQGHSLNRDPSFVVFRDIAQRVASIRPKRDLYSSYSYFLQLFRPDACVHIGTERTFSDVLCINTSIFSTYTRARCVPSRQTSRELQYRADEASMAQVEDRVVRVYLANPEDTDVFPLSVLRHTPFNVYFTPPHQITVPLYSLPACESVTRASCVNPLESHTSLRTLVRPPLVCRVTHHSRSSQKRQDIALRTRQGTLGVSSRRYVRSTARSDRLG